MKRPISMILALFLAAALFSACGAPAEISRAEAKKEGTLKIVTTVFPAYDWMKNLLGENPGEAEMTLLLDSGVDLHNYQLTVEDMLKISECDLFVYVGGASDSWVRDALKEAVNPDMIVIDLLEELGEAAKEEELAEGMQAEAHAHAAGGHSEHGDVEEEEHAHEAGGHSEHGDEAAEAHTHSQGGAEADEHLWLSLRNAMALTDFLCDAISRLDPEHEEIYASNADAYMAELRALDRAYQETVDTAPRSTLLFGDRFPFRYLTEDYGLEYYAAFPGCSAETEAAFGTITFLAQKADELRLHTVLAIEGKTHRIAETIVQNTRTKDQRILLLDSMQSVSREEMENGASYLAVMEENLRVLEQALS